MKCRQCAHYGFYRMITCDPLRPSDFQYYGSATPSWFIEIMDAGGLSGYYGKIPCLTCKHLSWQQDNFLPASRGTSEPTNIVYTINSSENHRG